MYRDIISLMVQVCTRHRALFLLLDFRGLITTLVKMKYAGVHEPELLTGDGSRVYSKVKILEFYP